MIPQDYVFQPEVWRNLLQDRRLMDTVQSYLRIQTRQVS